MARSLIVRLTVALLALLAPIAHARGEPATASAVPGASVATRASQAGAGDSAGAPRPHFDAEAATRAYLATLPATARARSDAYFEGGYWLVLWDAVVAVAVSWLLLGSGISAKMRDLAERRTGRRWLQTALYFLEYSAISTVITLPWSAYESYFREHQYGMSTQTLGAWLADQGKGFLLGLILGSLAAVAIYATIRRTGRNWWLWGAAVAVSLLVFQAAISPSVLEPVFNDFYPLPDSPLKQQILSMARANEIPAQEVYEFDASRQTTKISAHVSGLLGAARISVNDNLMNRGTPEEVKAIVGHEMGHYVLNHIAKSIVFFSLIIVVGFALLAWGFGRLQARYGARFGIRDVADVAGMPLLLGLFTVYLFALTPLLNTLTRSFEAEADAFGLNAARQPDGFAQAALQLSEYRKMHPGPIEEFLLFDHPSGWNRIRRAMIWKAENIAAPDIVAYDAGHPGPGSPH